MNRIARTFRKLRREKKKAFIPYIMAGDPDLERTGEVILLFERQGADIVELGIPFTDPLADGPTIQRAAERALKRGVTLTKVLTFTEEIRKFTDIPIVFMTYYNPLFRYGVDRFVRDAVSAGVDGVIVPDLPPEEAAELIGCAGYEGLATIFLLAPTSTEERIRKVSKASTGFIYYVSITGITGARLKVDESLYNSIQKIKNMTNKPLCVGFGVSTPEEAAMVSAVSDGVIVGSAIVRVLDESPEKLKDFVAELRKAI